VKRAKRWRNSEPLRRLRKLLTVQPGVLSASGTLQYANSARGLLFSECKPRHVTPATWANRRRLGQRFDANRARGRSGEWLPIFSDNALFQSRANSLTMDEGFGFRPFRGALSRRGGSRPSSRFGRNGKPPVSISSASCRPGEFLRQSKDVFHVRAGA
jgi:hypothetical protein